MNTSIVLVRLIHVLSATFWVGVTLFNAFYLYPVLATAGRSAVPIMAGLQKRKLMTVLPIAAALTVVSGIVLVWMVSQGDVAAYSRTPVGRTFTTSGGLAILAFAVGMLVARPAGVKAMQISREMMGKPESTEKTAMQARAAAIQTRAAMATMTVSVLLVLAASGMAVARYM